ncbi:hypothetical protein [Prescottella equi]|uniref:hypothetical protein n=1 Tax=Rhodococcus hoagii TaxID=43767 RepID=UPI0011A4D820|nr:hypothetical protein [Prescottella equi]BCN43457.1 hypothetical protein RE9414_17370 [Prescottella equi]
MARIRSISKGTQSIRPHDTLVDCFFDTVADENGDTLLHLTTFGSDYRRSKPKSSQSIQIDIAMAKQLVEVIYDAFPALGAVDAPALSGTATTDPTTAEASPIYDELAGRLLGE